MSTPEALRLADALGTAIKRLTAERNALREALQRIVDWDAFGLTLTEDHIAQALAALAQGKEPSNG